MARSFSALSSRVLARLADRARPSLAAARSPERTPGTQWAPGTEPPHSTEPSHSTERAPDSAVATDAMRAADAALALFAGQQRAAEGALRIEPSIDIVLVAGLSPRGLSAAIESVVAQTYPRWQLTVVDVERRAAVSEVLSMWFADDPRIAAVHAYGDTPAMARLGALSEGRGEWTAFIDDRHVWHRDWLRGAVEFAGLHPDARTVVGTVVHTPELSGGHATPAVSWSAAGEHLETAPLAAHVTRRATLRRVTTEIEHANAASGARDSMSDQQFATLLRDAAAEWPALAAPPLVAAITNA